MRGAALATVTVVLALVWINQWLDIWHRQAVAVADALIAKNRARTLPGMEEMSEEQAAKYTKARRREETKAMKRYLDELHGDDKPKRIHLAA